LALHCEKQPSASTVDTEQLIFIVERRSVYNALGGTDMNSAL